MYNGIHQDGTESLSQNVANNGAVSKEEKHRAAERSYWFTQNLISGISLTLAVSAVVLSAFGYLGLEKTLEATRTQAGAAIDQNKRAFPAKLVLSNMELGENFSGILKPNQTLKGEGFIINNGGERVIIDPAPTNTLCFAFWWKGNLPMHRPHYQPQPSCGNNWLVRWTGEKGNGSPGDNLHVAFSTTVPANYNPDMILYFMGWVQYRDDVSDNQFMLFARCYDVSLGRFVAVDNPDYENEVEKDVGKRGSCAPDAKANP